jgi:hypothetical protein
MPEKKRYKNPPIIERVICFYCKISPEDFEKRLPSWVEKIHGDYPVQQNMAEWTIDIEQKGGVPFVKNLMPKARLIRLFWKKHHSNLHVTGMRLRPDRLVFHLCRENENPHDFDELTPEMEKWLPLWAEHFGVTEIENTSVEYYNMLNGNITPHLTQEGSVVIGEAVTVFGNMPGKYVAITDPYDCKVRLIIDPAESFYFDLRIRGEPQSGAVRVDFIVRTKTQKVSLAEAIKHIYTGHDILLEKFDCLFTTKAKSSFDL